MCQGPFNKPKLPGIPGIEDFTGHTFHTARWDYDYTGGDMTGGLDGLAGKRVAIVGTGASGIQVIPHIARSAEYLYVLQRTPSTIDVRGDEPTDPEWVEDARPGLAGRAAAQLPHRGVRGVRPRPAGPDLRRLDRDQPQPGRAPGRHRRLGRAGRSGEVPGAAGDPGLPGDGTAAPPHRPGRRGQGHR